MRTAIYTNTEFAHEMLRHIKNVISPTQAADLAADVRPRDFFEPLIEPIVDTVRNHVRVGTQHPAYCVVEKKSDGHGWHKDTGNNDHMLWCNYSASILLTPPDQFEGGTFHTHDGSYTHYLDMLLYSSDVEHAVDPSDGDRRVLLMFFA